MNIYRATFYGVHNEVFKTLIQAKDFESAKTQVEFIMGTNGHFEVEGKGNRYFVVSQNNISFIEYELLLNDTGLSFKDLLYIEKQSLERIINQITDLTVLAVALKNLPSSEQEPVFNVLSESRKSLLKERMNDLWAVTMAEIYAAQEIISNIALNLKNQGNLTV